MPTPAAPRALPGWSRGHVLTHLAAQRGRAAPDGRGRAARRGPRPVSRAATSNAPRTSKPARTGRPRAPGPISTRASARSSHAWALVPDDAWNRLTRARAGVRPVARRRDVPLARAHGPRRRPGRRYRRPRSSRPTTSPATPTGSPSTGRPGSPPRAGAQAVSTVPRRTQNSLPSGSARTVQVTSPWPMSTSVAPSPMIRPDLGLLILGRAHVDVDAVLHDLRVGHRLEQDRRLAPVAGDLDRSALVAVDDPPPEDRAPEGREALRVGGVDHPLGQLDGHDGLLRFRSGARTHPAAAASRRTGEPRC